MLRSITKVTASLSLSVPKRLVSPHSVSSLLALSDVNSRHNLVRHKYSGTSSGIKGIKSSKKLRKQAEERMLIDDDDEPMQIPSDENFNLDNDQEYDLIASDTMHVTKTITNDQRVLIIQPYIKWGPKKTTANPDLQLIEAESLIRSLPKWSIEESIKIPLETFSKKSLFGTGKLEEIRELIRSHGGNLSCVFISKGMLSGPQKRFLEQSFKLPVLDRYSVVIQILRLHAKSTEAKLQVAMAEIPYIWTQYRDADKVTDKRQVVTLNDSQKQMLRNREKKLKYELENIRNHRELLRNRRRQKNFPIIAVVGYTNAGKTSLIKALTGEEGLRPKDQLFATLDVTAHAGRLPCQLEVLYMDTVGFMSDIPTGLLECFISTLEDAMLADIIVHVQDVAHSNYPEQKTHVEQTLESLIMKSDNKSISPPNIINVGNKFDLIEDPEHFRPDPNLKLISSTSLVGIDALLDEIEERVLKITKRVKMVIKVPNGGEEMAWLYKNAAVSNSVANPDNNQQIMLHIVIAESTLQQFKYKFLPKKKNV